MDRKTALAVTVGALALCKLLADERDFARALATWQRSPSLASAFHVVTSGAFLARDITALG